MSSFERYAIQRLIDQASALGVDVPVEVHAILGGDHVISHGAREWARLHPDEITGCCDGDALYGPERCTCWVAVYDGEQQPPRPPERAEELCVRDGMCGDCAFRKGSPERSDPWSEDALFELARGGQPFWCHDGMRRPVRWEHPDGRVVEGSPHDWQPPGVSGIPYRADGSPGLLCSGWMARLKRTASEVPP